MKKHISHSKDFGEMVTVWVCDHREGVSRDEVAVSWGDMPAVSIAKAQEFYRNFGDALQYAWRQERLLARRATSVRVGNEKQGAALIPKTLK